jgi:hypothetical protein
MTKREKFGHLLTFGIADAPAARSGKPSGRQAKVKGRKR